LLRHKSKVPATNVITAPFFAPLLQEGAKLVQARITLGLSRWRRRATDPFSIADSYDFSIAFPDLDGNVLRTYQTWLQGQRILDGHAPKFAFINRYDRVFWQEDVGGVSFLENKDCQALSKRLCNKGPH
jgi:hypothetical protein